MTRRCIMIIPKFEEAHRIEAIREQYDPLYGIVKPHITLVFPFGSDLTKDELHMHISSALSLMSPFPLLMRGISVRWEPDGYYIFLDAAEGGEIIRRISGRLYEGALSKYKSGRYDASYVPTSHSAGSRTRRRFNPHWRGSASSPMSFQRPYAVSTWRPSERTDHRRLR